MTSPNEAKMHPFTLRFSGGLEKEFAQLQFHKTIRQIRGGLLLGIFLYALFGVVDPIAAPQYKNLIWIIRFCICIPIAIIAYIFTFHSSFEKYVQLTVSFVVLEAGLGL